MRIGIDYGGIIADTNQMKSDWIKNSLGIYIPPWKTDRSTCISELSQHFSNETALKLYDSNLMYICQETKASEVPLVLNSIDSIIKIALSNEVIILTARNEKLTQNTIDVIDYNGLTQYISEIYSCRLVDNNKGRILTKLEICDNYSIDIVADDDLRHLHDGKEHKVTKVLFNRSPVKPMAKHNIVVVSNWQELVEFIEAA